MRVLLILICLVSYYAGLGQSLGEVGTTWTYSLRGGWEHYIVEPSQIIVVKDTLVKGENCFKIQSTNLGGCDFMPTVPVIMEKDSSVYFYSSERDSFIMFIDFKLAAGDSYEINWINKHDSGKLLVKVDSISYVTINGSILKKQYISADNGIRSFNVEKIGNSFDFFFWKIKVGWCDEDRKDGLRCFASPSLGHYSTGIVSRCDYTNVGIEEESKWVKVSIYPNPVTDFLYVELKDFSHAVSFKLYDLNGRVVLEPEIAESKTEVDVSTLANGIYFYEGLKEGIRVFEGKVIKQ